MARSAPSLTETTMRQAPKADLILSFHKTRRHAVPTPAGDAYSLPDRVAAIAAAMGAAGLTVTPPTVLDRITIDWFSWFYQAGQRPRTVVPTLDAVEKALNALAPAP